MKNTFKFLGIIALVVVIGLTACSTEEVNIDPCCDGSWESSFVKIQGITGFEGAANGNFVVLGLAQGGELRGITYGNVTGGTTDDMGMECSGCGFPVSLIGTYQAIIMVYENMSAMNSPGSKALVQGVRGNSSYSVNSTVPFSAFSQ